MKLMLNYSLILNEVLISVFSQVILVSLMAIGVVVLILIVKSAFKDRLSAKWHYYIWFILVATLFVPFIHEISLDNNNDFYPSEYKSITDPKGMVQENSQYHGQNVSFSNTSSDTFETANESTSIRTKKDEYMESFPSSVIKATDTKYVMRVNEIIKRVFKISAVIWVFGILLLMLYIITIYIILNFRINKTKVLNKDATALSILNEYKKLLKIRRNIRVIFQKHIKTPAICGVFIPRILMPVNVVEKLSIDELRYVILHELCHYKRKDILIGVFQTLLCVIHWFNPFIWHAFSKMKDDKEPMCDLMVLSYIKPEERKSYAETLLKILKCFSENHWMHSTANISQGSVSSMEWRLKLMKVLKRRSAKMGSFILILIAIIAIIWGAFVSNNLSFIKVSAKATNLIGKVRGNIFDRNNKILAFDVYANTIALDPIQIQASGQNLEQLSKDLGNILNISYDSIMDKANELSRYEFVKRKVSLETGYEVRDWIKKKNIKGVIVEMDNKRYYPQGRLLSHVIGFTGQDDNGLCGIEHSQEEYLRNGNSVILTIDAQIQYIVEQELDKVIEETEAQNGAVALVMDPQNGEILAMVSRPDFDLNNPRLAPPGENGETWDGYSLESTQILNRIWRNKAISDTYEPGSSFRAITAAIGLELGVVKPQTFFYDEDFISSIAPKIGKERFYSNLRSLGVYNGLKIDLPGETESIIHEDPTDIDFVFATTGLKFNISPLQLVSLYGTLANDGKFVRPQIVKEVIDAENGKSTTYRLEEISSVISKETTNKLKDMLQMEAYGVFSGGFPDIYRYNIAGISDINLKINQQWMASFAGFAPYDNPQIVCVVMIDEPSLMPSSYVTLAAGNIINKVLDYLNDTKIED